MQDDFYRDIWAKLEAGLLNCLRAGQRMHKNCARTQARLKWRQSPIL
jgi:hypothetical protein